MIGFAIQSEGILRLFVVPIRLFVSRLKTRPYCRVRTIALTGAFMHHPPPFTFFLRDAPRNDRGFEETVRDSGHRVDGT